MVKSINLKLWKIFYGKEYFQKDSMKILSKLAFALVVLGSLLVTHAQTDDKNNVIVLNADSYKHYRKSYAF